MADSNIGSLPQAQTLDDDSLLVAEQQGQAVKVTGSQLKEFGRQAVIGQVQGYVDQAEAAADRAVGAVSAVTDMTVEASALSSGQDATVTKSTKNGKVNLAFGLPRGEQGIPGPAGDPGPRGPQGAPGNGLTILGHYDTEAALRAAVAAPDVGDAYSVGTVTPYDTYIFDGVTLDWKNYGPMSGGGGGVLPEDVVTAAGGASITLQASFGDGPHEITVTAEDGQPLTAEDIAYDGGTVEDALDGLKSSVSNGKAMVASAITDKGVPTAQDATFQQMADNIGQITTGGDTSDATATSFDILAGKTAYTAAGKVEGVIPTLPAQTITPGTADKTIANGQYLGGTQTIKGDANLTSSNIKKGVALFGVSGALESMFRATLTVTADIGAVVTATCGDTSVEALSTTGTVVLELPIEGTWSVTAVRGVAQYNTVTLQVSSQYSAELTAEVHIEYFGTVAPLDYARHDFTAAPVGNFALFGGGDIDSNAGSNVVDSYDENLAHGSPSPLSYSSHGLRAIPIGNYALFGGGESGKISYGTVNAYDKDLSRSVLAEFGEKRTDFGAAAIGDYALFGGGTRNYTAGGYPQSEALATVEAYSSDLTKINSPVPLVTPGGAAAASNKNFAVFCSEDKVSAYDENLTRTVLNASIFPSKSARAGNYVVLADKYGSAIAYDLFLTRTELSQKIGGGDRPAATFMDFALFGSGTPDYKGLVLVCDPYLSIVEADGEAYIYPESAAASVGSYALFGGGEDVSGGISTVSAYKYK